ncbi:MAG: RagB/SusD family nutrient uptake outer membrane protein, partial [Prevotellaceae bacterium]|nr:RagB/SusD family nutrient uptake outer membrane protein [Prevotellaceae bacterium]
MKKYFLIILSSVVLFSSCKDLLTTYPADQISTGNMWTSAALAEQGINGLYENFYIINMSTDLIKVYSSSEGLLKQEWMGCEFQTVNVKDGGIDILLQATKSPSDAAVVYEWKWCYTGIHRINDAIANLYKAGLDDSTYENYLCQAKFLRAWYYTRLNQIYQGVPIYLEPITDSECTLGQSTSAEVWDVIIDDLNYCIDNQYFPDNTISTDYGRPSKGAAYSLRGNAYLWLAWENNEDTSYYQLAANDFEKVSVCGYGLWEGKYIDFFNHDNEKDHEMIFPIQFTSDTGYCDLLQVILGGYDQIGGWSGCRPSTEFVDYYQNADGTDFDWADYIPEWNDDVFVNDVTKREVFFFRDSVSVDDNGDVVSDYWNESETAALQERVNTIGADVFKKYYLKDGNEDRLRACYTNRDPRLRQTVLVPYDPIDCWRDSYNSGNVQYGKEKRWPYLGGFGDGKDFYCGVTPGENTYIYRKYVYSLPNEIPDRTRCDTDWPLIRYTDVY